MNKEQQVLGYFPANTLIHELNGTAKLIFLLLVSVACMTTYDTRFLLFMSIFSLVLFQFSMIHWHQISFVIKFIAFFSVINILAIYVFAPHYGVDLYHSRTVIGQEIGYFTLTQEQLFYELNVVLKYFCTIPLALLFILTTNPSEFASSLNRIGVNYRISYAVSLAMRYIPDIQEDYLNISQAQQARGIEMSKKAKLMDRMKGTTAIVLPLIFSSLDRIEVVSTAMELRRFGQKKKRTWYVMRPFQKKDVGTIVLAVVFIIISFGLFYVNKGRFYNPF